MKRISTLLILLPLFSVFSQETDFDDNVVLVDSLYREDQVYVGVTFNLLTSKPSGFTQNGLSAGLQAGFVRDFPFNKRRNKSIGIGLGFALDTYNQNLLIDRVEGTGITYSIVDDNAGEDFNRFSMYTLEVPIEYRWRTSTATTYSFWRIHTGFKIGYVFNFQSSYKDANGRIKVSTRSDINKLQYGPTFAFGYGAFNFQGYYGLNSLFASGTSINNEDVNLQAIKLGLIFYFL
ncbi:porin family protein [Dokdonia sp. Hel_I_53]|uniref:porin family protein n=1 Tax=Dokdonia sp. Hel_I_53 TaxID=1566287 RepID=UPI00119B25D9|nr:porin family protein [Dokdonia sp. Hel_I_53]TVZ52107.1 outer membrane protein with beta-barrel domain [Dokdonia sp. Hel_I_53]